jgi:hypothetical protein
MKQLKNNSGAADYIGIPIATLQHWRTTGAQQIPFIKVGRRVMYRVSDLDQWLDQHTYKHTGEYQAGGSNHE